MITDADIERTVQSWLAAEAGATYPPDALRRRILDIPTAPGATASWWQRFSGIPLAGAGVVTAGLAGLLVASLFLGLFDGPVGTDGETCNNRQVQTALDHLRDAAGYRYVNRDQTRQLDPDAQLDFADPQYVWTDAWASEGAYLAPDRAIDRPTFRRSDGLYDRGYLEHLQIAGKTYRLSDIDGDEVWVEDTNWPTANLAYGYIGAAFPTFSVPLVGGADWGGTTATPELPGSGGCTAATLVPIDEATGALTPQRAVALRIDVGALRPTAIAIGPAEGQPPREGESRSTWELVWETPDPVEFVAPTDARPDPNGISESFVPTPSPAPLVPEPGALAAIELSDEPGANVVDIVGGAGRFVAIGNALPDGELVAAIWTSTDGRDWESLTLPDGAGLGFSSVDWNGEMFLAIGLRNFVPPEGVQFTSARPETWVSDDGLTWQLGGEIGPSAASGEVANPGRPIFTGTRWVAGGAIFTLASNQQRPAFFTSTDGAAWQTIELDGVASGNLGSVVRLADGSLLALGCESPGATNSGQFGEACYQRPWTSDDGLDWRPGAISDVSVNGMARWGDALLGIVSPADPTGQSEPAARLATSTDGVTWQDLDSAAPDMGSLNAVEVLDDELIVFGQELVDETFIVAHAWRSTNGESWLPVPLGFPEGTTSVYAIGAIRTPSGIVIAGDATLNDFEGVALLWIAPEQD